MSRLVSALTNSSILLLLLCSSCVEKDAQQIRNVNETSRYDSVLAAYKDVSLRNDTVLLSLRLGMRPDDLGSRIKELSDSGKIIIRGNRLYAPIPLPVLSSVDNAGRRNVIAEMHFHFDKKKNSLASIKGILYCRYFRKASTNAADKDDPVGCAYRAAVGDSLYNLRKIQPRTPEARIEQLGHYLHTTRTELLELYKAKYGYAQSLIEPDQSETIYYWISQGRMIEVRFINDLKKVAEEHVNKLPTTDSSDYSALIEVGKFTYSTPATELEFQKSVLEATDDFSKQLDSFFLNEKQKAEEVQKEGAQKSGI